MRVHVRSNMYMCIQEKFNVMNTSYKHFICSLSLLLKRMRV